MATIPFKIAAKVSSSGKRASASAGKGRRGIATGYRTKRDRRTGLPVTVPPSSVPKVTSAQVRALLADFP